MCSRPRSVHSRQSVSCCGGVRSVQPFCPSGATRMRRSNTSARDSLSVICLIWMLALSALVVREISSAPTKGIIRTTTKPIVITTKTKPIMTTTTTKLPSTTTAAPSGGGFAGVLAVLIVINVVAILGTLVFSLNSFMVYRRYNAPVEELQATLNDTENVIANSEAMKQKCVEMLKLAAADSDASDERKKRDEAILRRMREMIVDEKEESVLLKTKGKSEVIAVSRDNVKLPIRLDNAVKLKGKESISLHVSKMCDYYGNPVYLSSAPTVSQFPLHWELIWQEEIGIIVWIGRMKTDTTRRMDVYIEEEKGKTTQYGPYSIKTLQVLPKYGKFTMYRVEVEYMLVKRELAILYAMEWLQGSVSWALRRDVLTLMVIKHEHGQRITHRKQAGIMFQCKIGTAGSATMLSTYIGYQMWLRHRKANMLGVLKYVRRHRYGAFEQTGDPGFTFLLQLQVVFTVMSAITAFCDKGSVPQIAKWVKDVWGKDASSKRKKGKK